MTGMGILVVILIGILVIYYLKKSLSLYISLRNINRSPSINSCIPNISEAISSDSTSYFNLSLNRPPTYDEVLRYKLHSPMENPDESLPPSYEEAINITGFISNSGNDS
ncbi:uncharacterized protein LOC111088422 [Limulus polyphemus]|uniref:Uncharacterized protein LOC111088422 n=1 Tax=Limulus polyphemus TaxID=6850 RepID=A0ABM1TEA5_LIMPO|nr:uncharacterized protein LOC111088422 [Limulus polyphemus]